MTALPTPEPGINSAVGAPRAGWFAMVLIGSIVILLAGALLAGGIAVSALVNGRYLIAPDREASSDSYALVSEPVLLETSRDDNVLPDVNVTIRATDEGEGQVFLGIGPSEDVADYLDGVHVSEVTGALSYPMGPQLRDVPGTVTPDAPTDQEFWVESANGQGTQEIVWAIEPGEWTVVVMNADGSPGIDVELAFGGEAPWVQPLATALIVGASVLLLTGILLVVFGAIGWGKRTPWGSLSPVESSAAYPSALTGELRAPSRWLWLVKWILAIPHWIVLALLWLAFIITTIFAGFAILFTGRYPRSLFEFNVGVIRWNWRVSFYAYSALGTDQYPPFSLDPAPYPADFAVAYPDRLSNGLVLVKSWLLAIPHLLVLAALTGAPALGSRILRWGENWNGISLLGVLVLVAAVILLFSGRFQRPIFDFIMGINRWNYRVLTYIALMRDEYPPFRLDQGPDEPSMAETRVQELS